MAKFEVQRAAAIRAESRARQAAKLAAAEARELNALLHDLERRMPPFEQNSDVRFARLQSKLDEIAAEIRQHAEALKAGFLSQRTHVDFPPVPQETLEKWRESAFRAWCAQNRRRPGSGARRARLREEWELTLGSTKWR